MEAYVHGVATRRVDDLVPGVQTWLKCIETDRVDSLGMTATEDDAGCKSGATVSPLLSVVLERREWFGVDSGIAQFVQKQVHRALRSPWTLPDRPSLSTTGHH